MDTNQSRQRIRKQRHSIGLCTLCGERSPEPSKKNCRKCLDKYDTTKAPAYQSQLKKQGAISLQLKLTAFMTYGGLRCACCREDKFLFLTLDHINGGGSKHREAVKGAVFCWLKQHNYPPGFQVLCSNCNWGKYVNNGICPHQGTHPDSDPQQQTRLQRYLNKLCTLCGEQLLGKRRWRACQRCQAASGSVTPTPTMKPAELQRAITTQLKLAAFKAYGGARCVCCREEEVAFLAIDHINGDGGKHRKESGRGFKIYRWLKRNNYPPGFQVLCFNCNWGKHVNNGVCPHKAVKPARATLLHKLASVFGTLDSSLSSAVLS